MCRNSITIYEDTAMDIVSMLEDLTEYVKEYEPDDSFHRNYLEKVMDLASTIERAVK